jgi:tRNA (mo5U34)-methyltransferase
MTEEQKNKVLSMKWVHCIPLPDGSETSGVWKNHDFERFGLPLDLTNKTVLDISCADGLFSFEAEKRGAVKVKGIDIFKNASPEIFNINKPLLIKEILNSRVEIEEKSVYDLDPKIDGVFDVVLFYGLFYHLEHPYLGLKKAASVCKETLIVETATPPENTINTNYPYMAVFPGFNDGLGNFDKTNFFYPNEAALRTMLTRLGFSKIETIGPVNSRMTLKANK